MVRLKREMEGLDPDPRREQPAWRRDERLRALVEAPAREAMRAFLKADPARLLTAGLPPELVVELAEDGWAVTVVEPDPTLVRALQTLVIDRNLMRRVSILQKELGHAGFEPSAFEAAALLGVLEIYPSPQNVLRKTVRELKMGGRLFATALAAPAADPRRDKLRSAVDGLARRLGRAGEHVPAMVDLAPALEELGKLARIDRVDRVERGERGRLTAPVAEAVAPLSGLLGGLAERVVKTAGALPVALPSLFEGATLTWIQARKELGFGRVFTPLREA